MIKFSAWALVFLAIGTKPALRPVMRSWMSPCPLPAPGRQQMPRARCKSGAVSGQAIPRGREVRVVQAVGHPTAACCQRLPLADKPAVPMRIDMVSPCCYFAVHANSSTSGSRLSAIMPVAALAGSEWQLLTVDHVGGIARFHIRLACSKWARALILPLTNGA